MGEELFCTAGSCIEELRLKMPIAENLDFYKVHSM
jgi:hypothetical protein